MLRDLRQPGFDLRILLCPFFIFVLSMAASASAFAMPFQAGKGQSAGDIQSQRDQAYDQQQQIQQQQQMMDDLALRQRSADLEDLSFKVWQLDAERIRLKWLLRENFRRHYATIRRNTEELAQLTSTLHAILESNDDPPRPRELTEQAGRMRKLAHEIRENMGGGRVPRAKPLKMSTLGISAEDSADEKQVLEASVNAATAAVAQLKSAVENYLANDNDQTVSVAGLQKAADKNHFDPNSISILSNSLKLEQLAREIRSQANALNAAH